MGKHKVVAYILIYGLGVLLQCLFSNVTLSFFAFPFNIILFIALFYWIFLSRKGAIFSFLTDSATTLAAMGMVLFNGMILGLVPQREGSQGEISFLSWEHFGVFQVTTAWWFVIPLVLLSTVLMALVIKRFHPFSFKNILFVMVHGGLLLALFGRFWGVPDDHVYKTVIGEHKTEDRVYNEHFQLEKIPFTITLENFDIEYYESGGVSQFMAQLLLADAEQQEEHLLRVNHPVRFHGFDIYLMDYQKQPQQTYAVLQLTHHPWQWATRIGLLLLLSSLILLPFYHLNKLKNR